MPLKIFKRTKESLETEAGVAAHLCRKTRSLVREGPTNTELWKLKRDTHTHTSDTVFQCETKNSGYESKGGKVQAERLFFFVISVENTSK